MIFMKNHLVKYSYRVVVLFSVIYFISSCSAETSFAKVMSQSANELNKSCPMMVDKDTRLDNAIAIEDKTFQYNYTLINLNKSTLDIENFRSYMKPIIVNSVSSNPDLKIYRDNNVTMSYYYKDKNGEFLTKIEVTPELYSE